MELELGTYTVYPHTFSDVYFFHQLAMTIRWNLRRWVSTKIYTHADV